jgi:hypothetical protein
MAVFGRAYDLCGIQPHVDGAGDIPPLPRMPIRLAMAIEASGWTVRYQNTTPKISLDELESVMMPIMLSKWIALRS